MVRGHALSPPAGYAGIVLGFFCGPVVSFIAGFIGFVSVGRLMNGGLAVPSWVAAGYIGIQLVPVIVTVGLGSRFLRARRPTMGWFLVVTGIMAFLPAAACDTAVVVGQHH